MTEKALYKITRDLAEEWSKNAEANIRERVNDILNKRIEELVLVLCGLSKEHEYGWRVDHCNNRSGNSPIGNFLKESLQDRIEYLAGQITISPQDKENIEKSFIDAYLREYRSQMTDYARRLAKQHAEKYIKTTAESALEGAAESIRLQMMEANK